MQLENLTKKNQEFIHIATTQLIKDGKSDEEIKALLEDILPSIRDAQKKASPPALSTAHRPNGQPAKPSLWTTAIRLRIMTTLGSCGWIPAS